MNVQDEPTAVSADRGTPTSFSQAIVVGVNSEDGMERYISDEATGHEPNAPTPQAQPEIPSSLSLHDTDSPPSLPHPMNPLNLHLISHPNRGRGVFAPRTIPAGTLIEESPVLVISQKEWEEGRMNDSILGSYGFCWKDGGMGIGLGLASLFNHSSSPNVNFIRSYPNSTIRFITFKKIEKGEELCICYSADESKLWFVKSDRDSSEEPISNEKLNKSNMSISDSEDEQENGFFGKIDLEESDLIDLKELELKKQRLKRLEASQARDLNGKIKKNLKKSNSNSIIQSPQPIKLSSSSSSNAIAGPSTSTSTSTTSSRTSTPSSSTIYPEASSSIITSLPPPLHSSNSRSKLNSDETDSESNTTEMNQLVDELDWDEEYWTRKKPLPTGEGREDEYAEFLRIKGPAEREDEEDVNGTMDIWTLEFTDPKLTRTALDFSKYLTATDERLRHLKRVCRRRGTDQETCRIVLAVVTEYEVSDLISIMNSYSSTLSHLTPVVHTVPSSSARTQEQLKIKSHIWPVSYSPVVIIPNDSSDWPIGRKAWVLSGIKRVIQIALEAKSKGELPIGTYCTSEPSSFWPKKDEEGFIPPTLGLRASSYDTRISTNHPLKHCTLNCISKIANLRTNSPLFKNSIPTKNGSDYLLTSLTLFITHEPCIMCSMSLLHSRVRLVIYIFDRKNGGGFNTEDKSSGLGIHSRKDLNHKYQVWKYNGEVDEEIMKELEIDDDIQI